MERVLLADKKVAIIGAGPVGLTLARLLQQKGVEVAVYERDKNNLARISGGTLDLHNGSGQDVLERAGLLEQYYAMAVPMGRTIADEQGTVLFSKTPAQEEQFNNPEINRNDLRKLLLDSLISDTVTWDRKFTGLKERDGKWLLQFENAETATADLVIGANGGMSAARKYVTDTEIEYTGTVILQGEVVLPEINCKEFYQLCGVNILMAAAGGNILVANPKNGGILTYNVIFKRPEEWVEKNGLIFQDAETSLAFLLSRFSDWNVCYKQLFQSTSSFFEWPTRKITLDKAWKNDRPLPITLIGDAAHIMPPFAGKGVNTGLMDALILSDNLVGGNYGTPEAAIKAYEQKMFAYAAKAQLETSRNELAMLHPDFSFREIYSRDF